VQQCFFCKKDINSLQFESLVQLLRLRNGRACDAVRLHFVEGLSVPDAAKKAGIDYQLALKAVYRARRGVALAKTVCDSTKPVKNH
jgi:DNA-directed RNA polymerase specialized sigma24 family protein